LIGLEKRINNMFTPIGFFAPSAAGFDPTLGGTLSVAYHWDFTDSSTMTLTGTDVTDITDKVSSYTLTSYGTNDPVLGDGFVTFGNGLATSIRSGVNSLPSGMFSNNTFTITVYHHMTTGNTQGLFTLQSNETNGWRGPTYGGYRDSMPGTWDPQLCDNHGTGTNVMFRYFGTSNKSKYSSLTNVQAQTKGLMGFGYDTTDGYLMYDNGTEETYCSRAFVNSTSTGDGFAVSIDTANTVNYYHIVVHDQLLNSTQMNDLYDAFIATQS